MATERDEIARGSCPCGDGEIVVVRCSPDHPWGGGFSIEGNIECAKCNEKYALHSDAGKFELRLVLTSDVSERKHRTDAWYKARTVLMESEPVRTLLQQLAARLEQEPSFTAKARLLNKHGISTGNPTTFKKRTGGDIPRWIAMGVDSDDLGSVLALLGKKASQIVDEANKVHEIWEAAHQPIPLVHSGIPVLDGGSVG